MQKVFDDLINSQTDYKAEIEADANFEQDVQIRAQAGTLDVILLPQPGAVVEQAKAGNAISLEDMGFNIDELNATFGEYFMSLGEYNGEHYGIPTNINLKSMVWYPKDDFDKAGYKVPTTWDEMLALSDQIVADGGTPWCVGFERGAPPLARDRLDRRHHAPDGGWTPTPSGRPTRSRSTTHRS